MFPVCSEWVSRACTQGIIKITNRGQIKQIRTNILMQPVLSPNYADQSKMLIPQPSSFVFANCPLVMICGPPGLERQPLPTERGSSPNSVDSAWRCRWRIHAAVTQQTSGELNTLDERISTMTLWTLASMESASGWTYVDIRAAVPDYKTITSFMMDGKTIMALLAVNWEEENVVWD